MTQASPWLRRPATAGRALRWLAGWSRIIWFGAVLVVLGLSPSSYGRATRHALQRHVYLDTAPILWGFTILGALLTLVITRIVVVTAYSYGLSQYALQVVIRVLVLELIPLTAAMFVALRCDIASGVELSQLRQQGVLDALQQRGLDPIRQEVLPRVTAGIFSTVTLAALSCVVTLVLAYVSAHGFGLGGFERYTRTVGHVFAPAVALIFVLKTGFFSLAVSVIPMASGLYDVEGDGSRESAALQGLVRMFAVLVVLEAVSLVGNYY